MLPVSPLCKKKKSAFYVTNKFITMYTTDSHLSLFSARLIQSSQHVLFNVCFNVTILLVQRPQSGLLSSCISIKIVYTILFSPIHATYLPILSTSISSPEDYLISTNHDAPHCTCININSDISCVFYMILCHLEKRLKKS